MAFDRESIYLSAIGTIGAGGSPQEIFTWGLRATGLVNFDATAYLAALDIPALLAIYGPFHQKQAVGIDADAKLMSLKVSAVGKDGKYLVPVRQAEFNNATGLDGTGQGFRPPNQIALCITTLAPNAIGHAKRGRFYLPLPNQPVQPDGHILPEAAEAVAIETAAFLSALNDELNPGALLSIMSDVGAGTTRGITAVRVGTVLDTIRSRRDNLAENYTANKAVTS